jgi:hypothetical protein
MPVAEGSIDVLCLDDDGQVQRLAAGVRPDEDGWIEAPACDGTACLDFHHASLIAARAWELRAGEPQQLHVRPLPRLFGRVVNPQGVEVAGATIAVAPSEGEDPQAMPPFVTTSTTTDAEGLFSFAWLERPPCHVCGDVSGCDDGPLPTYDQVKLVAQAAGYALGEHTLVVDPLAHPDPDQALTIALTSSKAALRVSVLDPGGRRYPRLKVLARSQARPYEQHRAESIEGGAFEFTNLGSGVYDLRAIQDGVEVARWEGVQAGEDLVMQGLRPAVGATLTVRVVDDRARPISGAVVSGGPFQQAQTDVGGEVRVVAVLAGDYKLAVRGPSGEQTRQTITVVPGEGESQLEQIELEGP